MAEAPPSPVAAAETPPAPRNRSPRKRRWGRWVGLGVTALLVVLIVAVLLLPTLLSTGPGRGVVVNAINGTIRGTVEMSGLSLSWFGGQSMRDVTLRDPEGGVVATVASIEAPDVRLLPAAMGSMRFGTIRVNGPDVQIRQEPGQPTNLERAIEMRTPSTEPTDLSGLGITLEVAAGRVVYESPGLEPVELSDLNATVAAPTLADIAVKLESVLSQGAEAGRLAADLRITDAVADGQLQLARAGVEGTADVINLPLTPVDRLAQQEGKLVGLLGESLTANLTAEGGVDALSATLSARSPRLQRLDATLATEQGQLRAREAQVALEVTPEAYAAWAGEGGGTLEQPFVLRVNVPLLTVPREGDAMRFDRARVEANVEADAILLTLPAAESDGEAAAPRTMAVRGLRLDADSEAVGERLGAVLTGTAEYGGESGPIDARAEVRNLLSETLPLAATVTAQAFPVALADAFAGQGGKLTATLGETLDARVNVSQPPGQPLAFDGTVTSTGITGPFAGTYADDGAVALRTPEPMNVRVTPAAFRAWVGTAEAPPVVVPAEAMELAMRLDAAYAPLPPAEGAPADAPARVDPERTRVSLELTTPRAVLENTTSGERYAVEQLRLAANGQDLREVLEVVANMRVSRDGSQTPAATEGDARGGALASTTRVHGVVAGDGTLQPGRAAFTTETNAREIPSAIIDSAAGQDGQLALLLGPTTTAAITGAFEPDRGGNLDIALRSANVRGRIPATIDPQMNVTIPQAVLDVNVTPEVSQAMLRNINPLLGSAVAAEAPLRLTMSDATFALPTGGEGVDWSGVSANARLTSKGLTLSRSGAVGQLLGLLAMTGRNVNVAESYLVDISDLPLRVQEGVLSYRDLGLRLGDFSLSFGGDVNLGTSSYDLRMAFGQDFPVRQLRGVAIPISGSPDQPVFSRDAMQKALVGAAAGGLLENVLRGRDRDEEPARGDQPIGQPPTREPQNRPDTPADGSTGQDPPRPGIGGLLDLLQQERERRERGQVTPPDEPQGQAPPPQR